MGPGQLMVLQNLHDGLRRLQYVMVFDPHLEPCCI